METIVEGFDDAGKLAEKGLWLGSDKFMVIQGDPGNVIRGRNKEEADKVSSIECAPAGTLTEWIPGIENNQARHLDTTKLPPRKFEGFIWSFVLQYGQQAIPVAPKNSRASTC